MDKQYLSEKHRQYSLACLKVVREMQKTPLTREEMKAQCDRIKEASEGNRTGTHLILFCLHSRS